MAEHDDEMAVERQIARLYRELPREEPPERLDAAIRDEARRAISMRPAPLVPPTGRRSWHYPAAAAAVLILAVAIVWHVEREQPDAVSVASSSPQPAVPPERKLQSAPQAPAAEPPAKAPSAPRRQAPPGERRDERALTPDVQQPKLNEKRETQPTEGPAVEQSMGALAKQRSAEAARDAAPAMSERPAAASSPAAKPAPRVLAAQPEAPEAWLERIAQLRREGRHEEADKALAEFRKRYPEHRIPPEMLERVEKK